MIKKRRLVRIQVQQSQLQEVLDGLQSDIDQIKQRLQAYPRALNISEIPKQSESKAEANNQKKNLTELEQQKPKLKKWQRKSISSFKLSSKEVQVQNDATAKLRQQFEKVIASNQALKKQVFESKVLLQSIGLKVQNQKEQQNRGEQDSIVNKSRMNILTLKVQDCYNRIISLQEHFKNQRRPRYQTTPQPKYIQTQQKNQGVQMSPSVLQNLVKKSQSSFLQEKKRLQSEFIQHQNQTAEMIQRINKLEVYMRVKGHQMTSIQAQTKNIPRLFNITEVLESKLKKAEHQNQALQNQISHLKLIIQRLNLTKLEEIQKMLHLEVMKSIYKLEGDIELKMAKTQYQEKQIVILGRIKKMSSDMLEKADFSQVQEYFKIMASEIKQIIAHLTQHKETSLLTKSKLRCLSCQKVVNKGELPRLQINNAMYPNRSLTFSLMKFRENQAQEKELLQSKLKKQKINKDKAKQ